MDGAGIDVWVGTNGNSIDAVMCIVDLMKRDSEITLLIGCTEEEKVLIYEAHNESQYMKGILIRRTPLSIVTFPAQQIPSSNACRDCHIE